MTLDGINYLGIKRVLERGSGVVLAEEAQALLVHDRISGAYFLACEDDTAGHLLLDRYMGADCTLLMVPNTALGQKVFERFGFSEKLECYQVAYYGEKPVLDSKLSVRMAQEEDLPLLVENYQLISPEELAEVVRRESLLLGYLGERPVGFIGEHLEGSMGILYIFPEYRRRGFGAALQKHLMAATMDKGIIPFGQVEKDNQNSLRMQERLGMTRSDKLIVWMWK